MSETSKTTHIQTRVPRANRLDPSFHYVLVEKDSSRHESTIDRYLDMPHPTEPGETMYEEVKNDRSVTGTNNAYLLRTPKAVFDAWQAKHTEMADALVEANKTDNKTGDFTDIKRTNAPIRLGEA